MHDQGTRIFHALGADCACHRRGDAASHATRRHHLHQHHERVDEREARQRLGAQPAEEIGFGDRHQDLGDHCRRRWPGQPPQAASDRTSQQRVRRQCASPHNLGVHMHGIRTRRPVT
jgi:hypothetical protein